MDLRRYNLSASQISEAKTLLDYQPFRVSDDVITGVAHSWRYCDNYKDLTYPKFVFDRREVPAELWEQALGENSALERMYEGFLDEIAAAKPGGSYLDLCCNNGLFPVAAFLRGMKPSIGIDYADFSRQIGFLNRVAGAKAIFARGRYRPEAHTFELPLEPTLQFDVVSCMAYLCHVPDPLHFLQQIANRSRHAVFIWSGFVESSDYLIRYNEPNLVLQDPFPYCFDAGTSLSTGLLVKSMSMLGFPNHREIAHREDWIPREWTNPLMIPYQPFRAFLFTK